MGATGLYNTVTEPNAILSLRREMVRYKHELFTNS